jgi:hypothetical protein
MGHKSQRCRQDRHCAHGSSTEADATVREQATCGPSRDEAKRQAPSESARRPTQGKIPPGGKHASQAQADSTPTPTPEDMATPIPELAPGLSPILARSRLISTDTQREAIRVRLPTARNLQKHSINRVETIASEEIRRKNSFSWPKRIKICCY